MKGGKPVSDATNSKSTYTSSTKAVKAEALLKQDSDTFSAFDAQQSFSGKSASNVQTSTNKRTLSYNVGGQARSPR